MKEFLSILDRTCLLKKLKITDCSRLARPASPSPLGRTQSLKLFPTYPQIQSLYYYFEFYSLYLICVSGGTLVAVADRHYLPYPYGYG